MTPLVATLARVNRELADAHRTGNLDRIRELSEVQAILIDLIHVPDRLMADVSRVADLMAVA